jgi:Xaa-Pro aminopeptidase
MLKLANCRERQARLLKLMQEQGLDLVVLSNPKTIYYFTGALLDPAQPHAFGIGWSGKSLLVTNQHPEQAAADGVELYTGYTLERIFNRVTVHEELVAAVARRFHGYSGPAGFEFDYAAYALGAVIRSFSPRYPSVDISPHLYQMRRRKDSDEVDAIRETIRVTEAAYAAIKSGLNPGMTECDVYNLASQAMANAAGTSVTVRGDFACVPGASTAAGRQPTGNCSRAIFTSSICSLLTRDTPPISAGRSSWGRRPPRSAMPGRTLWRDMRPPAASCVPG